jgi:hypothetical protein
MRSFPRGVVAHFDRSLIASNLSADNAHRYAREKSDEIGSEGG